MKKLAILALAAPMLSLAIAAPAHAKEDEASDQQQIDDFDLSSTISVLTDYRFRGISLSNRKPAVQGSIDVSHKSGVYASVWGSNIARYGGSKVEVDATLGWTGDVGPVTLDAGVIAYLYPGGHGVNVFETFGYIGKTIGPVEARVGAFYAPSQNNLGDQDSLYLTADARVGIPGTPVTVSGAVGRERGSFVGGGTKWDWQLGGEYVKGPFVFGVTYVDTNYDRIEDPSRNGKPGVVGSVSVEF